MMKKVAALKLVNGLNYVACLEINFKYYIMVNIDKVKNLVSGIYYVKMEKQNKSKTFPN